MIVDSFAYLVKDSLGKIVISTKCFKDPENYTLKVKFSKSVNGLKEVEVDLMERESSEPCKVKLFYRDFYAISEEIVSETIGNLVSYKYIDLENHHIRVNGELKLLCEDDAQYYYIIPREVIIFM